MPSSYLSRTVSVSGNRRTWTFSTWVKRSSLTSSGSYQTLFSSDQTSTNSVRIKFDSSPNDTKFEIYYYTGTMQLQLATNRLFRDTSAWYHIVVAVDTTQATASNRAKIYVNGVQETSLAIATYPSQNTDTSVNQSTAPHQVGNGGSNLYFDGSMASTYLIDGTALDATSFGETDATTGIWKPKAYSGSYGTNGFFLKFENSGSLGTDSSGNGNNFTVNGTPTQTVDTPSNVFCTLNPLDKNTITSAGGTVTFTNGNLTGVADNGEASGTFAVSKGKWYFECRQNTGGGNPSNGIGWYPLGTSKEILYRDTAVFRYDGGTENAYGAVWYNSGDIVGVALDLDNTTISYYKNGVSQGNAKTDLEAGTYMPLVLLRTAGYSISVNFGNGVFGTTAISSPYSDGAGLGKFQYQPPTGYYALCTKNINIYG